MKKVLTFLVAAVLIASMMAIPVFANSANKSFGNVPDVSSQPAITVDGVKDAAYDTGLVIQVNQGQQYGEANPPTSSGVATLVMQNNYLYVFGEITDPDVIPMDQYVDINAQPWMTDSMEVFLDMYNGASDDTTDIQFRVDAYGNLSMQNNASGVNTANGDSLDGAFVGAAKITATGYDVEFQIPITTLATISTNQVGLLLQINDMKPDGSREMVFPQQSFLDAGSDLSWMNANWDYIVLPVTLTPPPTTTAAPTTTVATTAMPTTLPTTMMPTTVMPTSLPGTNLTTAPTTAASTSNGFPVWAIILIIVVVVIIIVLIIVFAMRGGKKDGKGDKKDDSAKK